jgi:hypothetical protein
MIRYSNNLTRNRFQLILLHYCWEKVHPVPRVNILSNLKNSYKLLTFAASSGDTLRFVYEPPGRTLKFKFATRPRRKQSAPTDVIPEVEIMVEGFTGMDRYTRKYQYSALHCDDLSIEKSPQAKINVFSLVSFMW